MLEVKLNEPNQWSFVGEGWITRGDAGQELTAHGSWNTGPDAYRGQQCTNDDVHLTFRTDRAYGDFEAQFKFRWDQAHCGAGFIFRARDAQHYYLAHFPAIGQCIRAEHFWALISKVDGNGWTEILMMEMVHGVASEKGIWHDARLTVQGHEFRLWVDGRPLPAVRDDTFPEPGLVGFEAWGYTGVSASFRDLCIAGEPLDAKPWDADLQPVKNWFLPFPADGQQRCTGLTWAPNRDLLMALSPSGLVRSLDNARTWTPVEPENFPGGWIHTLRDGRLITLARGKDDTVIAESKDNGRTWSEPQQVARAPFVPPPNVPDMKIHGPGGFLELRDGTLLGFMVGSIPGRGHEGPFDIWEWGMWPNCAFSIRSTDGGRTWSAPVPLNGPPAVGQKYDLCECTSTMQTKEGKVLSLVRPIYSPWMWEIWSDDNGRTWGPATSGPFPCYAATALTTESGVLLVSGRMPGLGLYASHDSGMTWKPYRIDTAGLWAMGRMYEVEPNLVFYGYMDHYDSSMRAQFLRITEHGVEPAPEALP